MDGSEAVHPQVQKIMIFITRFFSFHVDLFVLITGYFGIKDNKRAVLKNIILCTIYLVMFNLLGVFLGKSVDVWQVVFPISHGPWWFMQVYFLIVLVAPFMEKMFSTLSRKDWLAWIITVSAINIYFGHIHHVGTVFSHGFNLINMINVYSIGALIRFLKSRNYDAKCVWFGIFFLGGGKQQCIFLLALMAIGYFAGRFTYVNGFELNVWEYCSPIVIMISVVVFSMFQRLGIKTNKIISYFSSSAIGVYLITEYPPVRELLKQSFGLLYSLLCPNVYMGLLFIFAYAIALFIICTLIDKARLFSQQKIENAIFYLSKVCCLEKKH